MRKPKQQPPTRRERVHEAFRQGLYLDGDSEAAAFAFEAVHAFHKDNRADLNRFINAAREMNEQAWTPLFEILTQA